MLREGVPHKHLEGSLVYMYFPSFSLENKPFGIHQTSFLPVEALEFSELKTPLVYTFFPPNTAALIHKWGCFLGRQIFIHYRYLVAHPCGDPNRATQCRAWSVASNSRRIRDVAPISRYTPPKSRCRTFLRTALSHCPLIRSRQGARRAGGGYRATFGFRKRIALQGGIAATVTPVALLCATKYRYWEELCSPYEVPNCNLGTG